MTAPSPGRQAPPAAAATRAAPPSIPGATPAAVVADGLGKRYGDLPVLTGVSLDVPTGTVFALLGPNGAGKTTTVRILATLTRADSGRARVAGFDTVRDRREVRRRISLTGQYAAVDEGQTGYENLVMIARLSGLPRQEARRRAGDLLDAFDLAAAGQRRAGTYSGGMRRRLDLAAGLVARPAVVFLDEPTNGLDPRSRQEVWSLIGDLTRGGTTVFLTTQYLEEADRLADRIALLDEGRIVAEDTPAALKAGLQEQLLHLRTRSRAHHDAVVSRLRGRAARTDADTLTAEVPTDGSAVQVRRLLDDLDPDRDAVAWFEVRSATLDDVFLALTGHRSRTEASHA